MTKIYRHNLPKQSTAFVGRQHALRSLAQFLTTPGVALVTILAPGGMGKTRLALAAAEQQVSRFADGVFFVPLAPLSAASDIVTTIAENIGFNFYGENPPVQQLIDFLHERSMLLVLDNFEHLLDGAGLVGDLIQDAPGIRVLVTSRERLNLRAETVYGLGGLDFPSWEMPQKALEYEAIKLFMQSAQRIRPDFEIQTNTFDDLVHICRLTAGMPLGIELAAGWVDVLSLEQIAAELQQSLDILETDLRDVPERHRSLRATFERTWERLSDEEQRVFMCLSVFRGGFTSEAARAVAEADLRSLRRLANKALIQVSPEGRHDIHELLRQFGAEKLTASGEHFQIETRHASYFADFMQWQELRIKSSEQIKAINEIETELDNILMAWHSMTELWNAADIRKTVTGLFHFLDMRGRFQQGLELFGQSAEMFRSAPDNDENQIALGHLLARQAWFYISAGAPEKARPIAEEGLMLARRYGGFEDILEALKVSIRAGTYLNQWEQSKQAAQEGLTIARNIDSPWQVENFLYWLGQCNRALHDYASAEQMGKEGLEIAEARGDLWWIAGHSGMLLGTLAREMHDYATAKRRFERSIELMEMIGQRWMIAVNYGQLGDVALAMEDFALARHCYMRRLMLFVENGTQTWETVRTLFSISALLAAQGDQEQAVEALALYLQHPATLKIHRDEAAPLIAQLQADLSLDVFAAAWARGEARGLSAIVNKLLERWQPVENQSELAVAQPANQSLIDPLSERELEVLRLLASGASNQVIADQLFIGVSTVKKHVNHIFDKLAVESRTQAIVRAQSIHLL